MKLSRQFTSAFLLLAANGAAQLTITNVSTEVFAQTDVHWTKVKVEPKNPQLFVVEPQTVTANVTPVP